MRKGEQIAVRLAGEQLDQLDEAVERGGFQSRAEALRAGLEMLVVQLRELQIADEYRHAYAVAPDEAWVGEAGAELAAEVTASSERARP